jgi:hypothetical protein
MALKSAAAAQKDGKAVEAENLLLIAEAGVGFLSGGAIRGTRLALKEDQRGAIDISVGVGKPMREIIKEPGAGAKLIKGVATRRDSASKAVGAGARVDADGADGTSREQYALEHYQFQAPISETREHLNLVYSRLVAITPSNEDGKNAKDLGLLAAIAGDRALVAGDSAKAKVFDDVAVEMLDIAMSLVPVVNIAKDAYELIAGKRLVDGSQLSDWARLLAAVGVLSLGGAEYLHAAVEVASEAGHVTVPLGKTLIKAINEVVVLSAEEANAGLRGLGYTEDAYKAGTRVYEFTTSSEVNSLVRVFGADSDVVGRWIVDRQAIEGLSRVEIAEKFSLPNVPTFVADVTIPNGVRIRTGTPAKVMFGETNKLAYPRQYQFVERPAPDWFSNLRPLGQ